MRSSDVLIVLPTLEGGGAERFNLELAAALERKGARCTIFCLYRRGPLLAEAEARGLTVLAGSTYSGSALWRLALGLLVGLPRLWRLIRRHDVTIAGLEGLATIVTAPLARLARRPLLAEVQVDLDGKFARPGIVWRLLALASRRVYPYCSHVIGISAGAAASVGRLGAAVPVEVVPMAVDADRVAALAGPAVAPSGEPTVLAVGRLTGQKSFDLLLRAHAAAREAVPHRLLVLGEGDEREQLEALADRLGVADTVDLPGFTTNPYVAMRAASVMCLSSRYEGMPTVLLEALALGCPVIATDCSEGVRTALADGRHGALVPPGDEAALTAALVAHLRNPAALRAQAENAVAAIKSERSYDVAAERYLSLMPA